MYHAGIQFEKLVEIKAKEIANLSLEYSELCRNVNELNAKLGLKEIDKAKKQVELKEAQDAFILLTETDCVEAIENYRKLNGKLPIN